MFCRVFLKLHSASSFVGTSPNPIEPKWAYGKRAVSEADRLLSAAELEARVYAYYGCKREAHLGMPKKVT